MTDIDPIRRRHNDFVSSHPCSTDTCDTRIVLDALDACMKLRSERHRNADICTLEKAALKADADRLAEAGRILLTMVAAIESQMMAHAQSLAEEILASHTPGTRKLEVNKETRYIEDVGPLEEEEWWCSGPDHDDACGGPWPCDAVRLARAVKEASE